MAQALERAGVLYAHIEFEGEGHGFAKPSSIQRALETELAFVASVLGLHFGERLELVPLRSLHAVDRQRTIGR